MAPPPNLRSACFGVTTFLVLGLIFLGTGKSQTADLSAAEIIRFLTDPTGESTVLNKNGVRSNEVDRGAANSLVALGAAAIPGLDEALDLIEQREQPTRVAPSSKWLLFAYARIRGPAAYKRLRAMADNPTLRYLRGDIDQSLAIALGLTSYISASRIADPFVCCGSMEPRNALDQLILAWLQGNRSEVEDALGARARLALGSLLTRHSWLDLHTEIWHGASSSGLALGYRFDDSGDWSQPDETLDQTLYARRHSVNLGQFPVHPDILTHFVGISGLSCGSLDIEFVRVPKSPDGLLSKYVVDDPDLRGLLRTITECAVKSPTSAH